MSKFLMNPWTVAIGAGFVLFVLTVIWASYSNPTKITLGQAQIATSTPNLGVIFKKKETYSTSLEKGDFIKNYSNTLVYASGTFNDINKIGQGYIVQMTVENNAVSCGFSFDFEKELLLLQPGQTVSFSGTFTGEGSGGFGAVNPWYIKDCTLLN